MDNLSSNLHTLVIEDENKGPATTNDGTHSSNTFLTPKHHSDEPPFIGETIPVEIPTQIFHALRPSLDILKEPHSLPYFEHSTLHRQGLYGKYLLQAKNLISLRLVCRFWNDVIVFVSHQEAVLPTRPLEKLEKASVFFTHGTEFVRSLVLCDLLPGTAHSPTALRSIAELLTARFSQLANSDIRSLELYGKVGPMFNRRWWLKRTLPRLVSTVERLVMCETTHFQLSLTLVELGRSISTLEIEGWNPASGSTRIHPTAFHLPAQMPHIKHLSLKKCYLSNHSDFLVKLFSRIGSPLPRKPVVPASAGRQDTTLTHRKAIKSCLESLTLVKVTTSDRNASTSAFIVTLLRINSTGKNLTSLTIQPSHVSDPPQNVTDIVKECPFLVQFRYISPVHQSLFAALPASLRDLSLSLQRTPMTVDGHESCLKVPQDFIWALDCRYTLRSLTVVQRVPPPGFYATGPLSRPFPACDDLLQAACEIAKVILRWEKYF